MSTKTQSNALEGFYTSNGRVEPAMVERVLKLSVKKLDNTVDKEVPLGLDVKLAESERNTEYNISNIASLSRFINENTDKQWNVDLSEKQDGFYELVAVQRYNNKF